MNIEAKKLRLMQRILMTTDEKLLDEVEKLILAMASHTEGSLEASISAGLMDIEEGKTIAHEDVQEYIRKKYGL
jgi:hypothetical protein